MYRHQAERLVSAFEMAVQGFGNESYDSLREELIAELSIAVGRASVCEKRFGEGCRVMALTGYGDAHQCDRPPGHKGQCSCYCCEFEPADAEKGSEPSFNRADGDRA